MNKDILPVRSSSKDRIDYIVVDDYDNPELDILHDERDKALERHIKAVSKAIKKSTQSPAK